MFVSADMFCLLAFNIAYAGLGQSNNLFNFSEPWMEDADITDETQTLRYPMRDPYFSYSIFC